MPKFSVLIVGYRSIGFVSQCIDSILEGTYKDFELLFLDNNSPDPEYDYVKERYKEDRRVRVFHSERNLYFAGGMNFLANKGEGEYLVLVNPDAVAHSGFLHSFNESLNTAIVHVGMGELRRHAQPHEIQSAGIELTRLGLVRQLSKKEPLVRREIDGANGACFIVRRDLFSELGMFDESFEMYFEETDFCWRARLAGYHVELLPGAVLYHKEGGSSEGHGDDRRQYRFIRNRIWSYAKNCRESPRWLYLSIHCLLVGLEATRKTVQGDIAMGKAHAKALFDGLIGLKYSILPLYRRIGEN